MEPDSRPTRRPQRVRRKARRRQGGRRRVRVVEEDEVIINDEVSINDEVIIDPPEHAPADMQRGRVHSSGPLPASPDDGSPRQPQSDTLFSPVRHCIYFMFPLSSRLRQCLHLAFPLNSGGFPNPGGQASECGDSETTPKYRRYGDRPGGEATQQ